MNTSTEMEVVRPESSGAAVEVAQAREVAAIQAAMAIAKRFPRDQIRARDRILEACTRQGLAEAACYQYARGGSDISGPSIRLAEAIAQQWGNLEFGVRELDQQNGVSTIEAFAWDLETNTRQIKSFKVTHKRHTKKGSYALDDPRDIYELTANQGARRLRACILGVVPGDVVQDAVDQCERTLRTKAEVTPERITALIGRFAEYGITKAQIETRVQRHLESITPAQMVNLGKIYNSLKDGMSSPADWFEVVEAPKAAESLKQKLKKPPKKATEPPVPEPVETDTITKDRLIPCPERDGEARYESYCNGECP